MKSFLKISFLLSFFAVFSLSAQNEVEFKASAPDVVFLDTPFQLIYSVNGSGKELQAPDFQVFDILAGPFESRSSYTQIVNGKRTSSTNISYTFTLMPSRTGTFKVPGAHIMVKGKRVTSNDLTIKVVTTDTSSQNQNPAVGGAATSTQQRVTNESVFVRTIVSKTNVYEQEAIALTYKLYTLVDVAQFTDVKLPDFNGFLKQDIEQAQHKQLSAETYKGKNYGTVVLYQTILFPQHSGEIEIEKANFTAQLRLQNKAQVRSIFDDFFDTYTNVERNLVAPAVRIKVNELPLEGKPTSFSGAVGNFTLSSDLSSGNLKTDEAATIKVVITGSGNMKLLKTPDIKFPSGLEIYDPKVENEFSTGASNVSGSKTIEYMFIPRRAGKYDIPPAELSYFDLTSKSYRTLRTPPLKLNVVQGEGGVTHVENFTGRDDAVEVVKDLRYIYTGPVELQLEKRPFFGTFPFIILFLLPLIIAAILFVYLQKLARENADVKQLRTKRANKMALKRLKLAEQELQAGNKKEFYDELMKTIWSYFSDKLSIPTAELNKSVIREGIAAKNIDSSLADQFEDILNRCEFASYAPGGGEKEMGNIYEETLEAISEMENQLKGK